MRILWVAVLVGLLTGCASLGPTEQGGARAAPAVPERFLLEGNFALRLALPGEAVQQANGRLTWTHRPAADDILLSTPLGHAVAELQFSPGQARLTTAQGRRYDAVDPEALLRQATGYVMPVGRLARWVRVDFLPQASVDRDALGRVRQLREDGWFVDYTYESPLPAALPSQIDVNQAGQVELRLKRMQWEALE